MWETTEPTPPETRPDITPPPDADQSADVVQQLLEAADACATARMWSLPEDDLLAFLDGVFAAQQMLQAAVLHAVRDVEGRGIPKQQQFATANMWLRSRLRVTPTAAGRLLAQARLLDGDAALDAAVVSGRVNTEQLTAITRALQDLPTTLSPEQRTQARAFLVDWAPQLDPLQLNRVGCRILEHVAPEASEAVEEARLRRAEREAREQRFVTLSPLGDGRVRLRGILDNEGAAIVSAALGPLCTPRLPKPPTSGAAPGSSGLVADPPTAGTTGAVEPAPARGAPGSPPAADAGGSIPACATDASGWIAADAADAEGWIPAGAADAGGWIAAGAAEAAKPDFDGTVRAVGSVAATDGWSAAADFAGLASPADPGWPPDPVDDRHPGQRRADALVEVCRLVMSGGSLPGHGGDRPQLAVTVSYDAMLEKLGSGVLDTGEPISASTVRRIACDARVFPVVLGTAGEVLDAGRSTRLGKGVMRRALVVRDRGCTFPACDRPARWCDAHHLVPWSEGGVTALGNLALLCEFHHHVLHADSGWEATLGADGHPEFHPPVHLDPARKPLTNAYHRRT